MAHSIGHVGRNIYETAIVPSNKVVDGISVENNHACNIALSGCMYVGQDTQMVVYNLDVNIVGARMMDQRGGLGFWGRRG
jgi:hypothetical protein